MRSPSRAARKSCVSSSTATDDTGGNLRELQRRLPRMTCMQIHQAISARLDGEEPGLDEAVLYAHLAGCADCRAFAHEAEALHRQRAARSRRRRSPISRPSILTAIGEEERRADASADRRRPSIALRWILLAIGVAQIAIAVPALVFGADAGLPVHAARHIGSFDVAIGVGFLYAAWKPSRIPGLLPMVAALVACLVVSSFLDVASGNTGALGEVPARARPRRPRGGVVAQPSSAPPLAARHVIRRLGALGALVVALVVVLAAPVSAHATLVSSTPSNGGIYTKPPEGGDPQVRRGGRGLVGRRPRLRRRPRPRRHRVAPAPERRPERGVGVAPRPRRRHLRRDVAGHLRRLASGGRRLHVPGRDRRRR